MVETDVVVIGAGASGLICAIEAGKRKRNVKVLELAAKPGKKILMSGGGRCNFTNYSVEPDNYISHNPHFCKSALSRFTQWDFLDWVQRYRIPYHEREFGRLFCNDSAKDILNMLLTECDSVGVDINLNTRIEAIEHRSDRQFLIKTKLQNYLCRSLVIATGGLSIPKMGASPFGYKVAEQFGIKVWPTSAGLVPFTLQPDDKQRLSELSGIALLCRVSCYEQSFTENLLFTHRGLSGPAMLQISNYWRPGQSLTIDLLPETDLAEHLWQLKTTKSKAALKTMLAELLPKRLLACLIEEKLLNSNMADLSAAQIDAITDCISHWTIKPNATEGYRTAEVTLGGVDCNAISSKTMGCHDVPGLYFIGEVLDVTGWLGGYNFQWAWSSGWCAGQYV
ncbi:NAD(P)/FAD-dependent oxidoreductase [Methylotuvimicrobium buryatense]|uniref:NAD(P)/FAD-dependent oxidoreductase n=1 Tax=Methylotuvimicrobium buryatense TaxID=95641 RepID=A0A4P9UPU6_METBY|nr:NAD(P)/FAD-dependent oxidoreductase [Methylotuvimicrobium buryatense]QCW83442.1 NAD(P)/FAD-dependent oxidoreductase [Methylotuvimicrobium buryatense]